MVKIKSEAFINNQLLANRDKKKWSRRDHERAHGLHRRTLVQPNNYDWPEVPAFTMT